MGTYVLRRILWLLLVALGVLVITFALMSMVPGDIATFYVGQHATPQVVAEIRRQLGLDQPKMVQFAHYVWMTMHGNLGQSATMGEPVLTALVQKLPATALLAGAIIVLEMVVALLLGIPAAQHEGRWFDRTVAALAALAQSLPSFWVGLMLLYLVAFRWAILPLGGYGQPVVLYLILPAATLGVPGGFWYARLLKTSLSATLREDYIRTARSKGVARSTIVLRHALINAIAPVIAVAAMDLGQLLGGVVVVEAVFGWPGIGQMAYQAVQSLDIPLVVGTVLFTALCIAVLNLAADLLRMVLDPRVRLT